VKKNLAVVLGSGASFDSGYKISLKEPNSIINPPTDLQFFENITDTSLKYKYYALWKFKNLYFSKSQEVRLEDVWTAIDLNHKHITLDTYNWSGETAEYQTGEYFSCGNMYPYMDMVSLLTYSSDSGGGLIHSPSYGIYKFLGDCQRDLRRIVYDFYSSYISPENIDNLKLLHSKLMKTNGCNLLCYITFNYDCYLENALTPDFKYISTNENVSDTSLLLHYKIPVVKLHGSLNWEEKVFPRRITFHGPPYDKEKQVRPSYYGDSDWSQPAIIPPTIFKQEINDDARTDDILTQTILQQWRAAIRLLQEADKIIFIGYSFPPTDYHSRRIFHIARMRQKLDGKDPFTILYCGGRKDRRETVSQIFGKESEIVIRNEFSKLCKSDEMIRFLNS
jgi:hypothetical protein